MTIVKLQERTEFDLQTHIASRAVTLWITDGTDNYITQRGGLPMTGDLMPALLADEVAIWAEAVAGGQVATAKENAKADRLIFLTANAGAMAIFDLSLADVETNVNALVDAIIPTATAANRTKLKRVLTVGILVNRESVAGE